MVIDGCKRLFAKRTFPEENKAKFHRFGIENVLYEVNKAFTPHLTVIDGTIGGEAWGPLSCKPVKFQTIIASNDVAAADALACLLTGYDPFSIEHINKAHKEGLGKADIAFDFKTLPYSNKKDRKWKKPEPAVSAFYEGVVEAFLLLPGMQDFFDLAADFVLYGSATLPILRDLTPETEKALNDILAGLFRSEYRSSKWVEDDLKRIQDYLKNL